MYFEPALVNSGGGGGGGEGKEEEGERFKKSLDGSPHNIARKTEQINVYRYIVCLCALGIRLYLLLNLINQLLLKSLKMETK